MEAAITVSAVNYGDACSTIPAGYQFTLTADDQTSGHAIATTVPAFNQVVLISSKDANKKITTTCNIPASDEAALKKGITITCTTVDEGKVEDNYGLKELTTATFATTETITIPNTITTKITNKANFIELGDNTSGGKTIEKNAEVTFTIKYKSGLATETKPSKVVLGESNITDKCTVTDATTLTCTIAKDTLATEGTFDVKVTNACGVDENTGIQIKVGGTTPSSSSFAVFSKITFVIAGFLVL